MSWVRQRREMNGHSNGNNNGHTNGNSNGNHNTTTSSPPWDLGIWSIGLISTSSKRYLTAETFGHKINANGTSLKKKQTWRLEPAGADGVCLKSHLDRYLAVDQYGNVTADLEERERGVFFDVVCGREGTWTLLNASRGYYLGAEADKLICTSKTASSPAEKWSIHLAARPQVTLKSVGRKRFAHLAENLEEIVVDANVPWGADTLFTLEFRSDTFLYALHTCNGKYLRSDGKLQNPIDPTCLFSVEYHHGQMALRDHEQGLYLAPIGSRAVLKTRSHTVTKDELFVLEDSVPQGAFVARLNGRYVSTKQGVDVTANQDEISTHETFQLEFEPKSRNWYVRTMQDKYWTVVEGTGGIQAGADRKSPAALFHLTWSPNSGTVTFRGQNGKYVGAKRSGHLYANIESPDEDESAQFWFYLINRPILVLKCDQGYVGYKNGLHRLECNRAGYECIGVERKEEGVVHFKDAHTSKYWSLAGDEVSADSDTPTDFYIELREPNRICIKISGGGYLVAEKNGVFRVGGGEPTLWEF